MAAPFLRIPPFPGQRARSIAVPAADNHEDVGALIEVLADARVGGTFWAAQPDLPPGRDVVLAPDTQAQAWEMLDAAAAQGETARAVMIGSFASRRAPTTQPVPVIARLCDPWHLAGQAGEIRAGADNELALVAALLGRPLTVTGKGRFSRLNGSTGDLRTVVSAQMLTGLGWRDPFFGKQVAAREIAALLAAWRGLIDANRSIAAVFGVARWKRLTMDALLWDGSGSVRHAGARAAAALPADARTLAWKTRTPPALLDDLAARGIAVGEIEDGMIRSSGLGANCVPPLSVIIDPLAAHFDPSQPSTLENLLQHGEFTPDLITRARDLRARLVAAGISKYGQGPGHSQLPASASRNRRRRVLVTGQVEDDRAVLLGGAGCSNRDLLARARTAEPDAEIIYKPHPDVEAGHRRGAIPDPEVLALANRIERHAAISTLLDEVDGLHVISSLAGFEGLCRGVAVTTHGVPFYAGWGLTRDLGPVPPRRRRRTLDELIAAVLILYPRYLDPVTRLPCPVEVLVERMATGQAGISSPLATLRTWQGKANLWFGS